MKGKIWFMKKSGEIIFGLLFFFMAMASCTYHENVKPDIPKDPSFAKDVMHRMVL